jgi:hypothetical protein
MVGGKIIGWGIPVLVVFVAVWLVIAYLNPSVEYYQVFEDERELFDAVKDEVKSMEVGKLGYQSDSGDIFLYRSGGNAAPDQFHDEVSSSLRDSIEQINEFSGDKLDQLRYAEGEGEMLISFVFDWERAYGDTYHIVYGDSREAVEKLYDDVNDDLKVLDDNWFGIRFK